MAEADREAVAAFAKNHAALLSRLTVFVNNAGLAKGLSTFQEGNPEDWDVTIDTNVKGFLYMAHAILPFFLKKGDGHVVNLGSVAGHLVYPKGNVYCASKHAVKALNEAMRIDMNGSGIRVTAVSPGMVETEFSEVRLGDKEKAKAIYAGMRPLKPQDIADAIVWSVNRPKHVNIQEIVIYPTDQASPTLVTRRS